MDASRALALLLAASLDACSSGDAASTETIDAGVTCSPSGLVVTAQGKPFPLQTSHFGVSVPDGELYLEAYRGAPDGCPTQDSPTPEMTLVVAGIPRDLTTSIDKAAGLSVVLFDFNGALGEVPLIRATGARLTPIAACREGDTAFGYALEASFPGATLSGEALATRCESLDAP